MTEVVPVNFGLKYNPPKMGIQYHVGANTQATFVQEINLAHLTHELNLDKIADDLFSSYAQFLNPKLVSRKQILRLLSRLKANLKAPSENKENIARANKEEMKAPEPQRTPLGGIHDITDPFPINAGNDENNNQSPTSFLHPSQRSVIEKQEEEEDTLLKTDGFTRQLLGDLKDEFHGSAKSPGVEEEDAAEELSNI